MLAINEILQERYRIVRQLGQGGMGAIYVAEDVKRFGKLVALKEILIDLSKLPDQKQRDLFRRAFEREAKILTQLEHEAFPQVVDYFLETNRQFLVMELIQGEDLGGLLDKNLIPFPLEDVLKWTDQLLDALDYLHTLQPPIIHRDIKPQNLKVTSRGKIKLLDFGIATGLTAPLHTTITNSTFIAATLHYSPLEQIIKVIDVNYRALLIQKFGGRLSKIITAKSDASSDIYALGATLYHLLTARLPIDALQRILQAWEGKPDPLINPCEVNPKIPQAISEWLLKAMAIERENRFASAAEMQKALREAIYAKTRREEEAKRQERLKEQEQLKRERELMAQERQNFEAERLSHWRQIEVEQKRQAEREAQKQISKEDDWAAQNREIAKTEPSFIEPAITEPSVAVKPAATEPEIKSLIEESKTTDTFAASSNFTEHSYLPKNFHENKKAETKTEPRKTKIEDPPIPSIKPTKKIIWVLPVSAVVLLLLISTVLGIWYLTGKSNNANDTRSVKSSATPTPAPTITPMPVNNSVNSNRIIANTMPNVINTPTPTISATKPTPLVNQTVPRPTPQPRNSRSQPTKTAKPKPAQDPNCVFTNSCQ